MVKRNGSCTPRCRALIKKQEDKFCFLLFLSVCVCFLNIKTHRRFVFYYHLSAIDQTLSSRFVSSFKADPNTLFGAEMICITNTVPEPESRQDCYYGIRYLVKFASL